MEGKPLSSLLRHGGLGQARPPGKSKDPSTSSSQGGGHKEGARADCGRVCLCTAAPLRDRCRLSALGPAPAAGKKGWGLSGGEEVQLGLLSTSALSTTAFDGPHLSRKWAASSLLPPIFCSSSSSLTSNH